MSNENYAGFWIRVASTLIDTVALLMVTVPLLTFIYGTDYWALDLKTLQEKPPVMGVWDVLLNYIFPVVAVISFWLYKSATPGKMLTKLKIVDAKTGEKPKVGQFFLRYIGFIIALLPFLLGVIWVGFDKRKQGWHDKLASTVVIRV